MNNKQRVVITGMGTVNPLGNATAESWRAAKAGVNGIAPITLFDTSGQQVKLAGEVKGLDIPAHIPKKACKGCSGITMY